jgi:N6-L-threonylcarbamoyladenine synthase
MKILSIDTSCDETAAAVTFNDHILSNVTFSQILMHEKFGGVVPDIARRNHEERIDEIVEKALKSARTKIEDVDAIAVTFGPGLAIALGVGINKAKDLARQYNKPLIPVNHMEGHTYASIAKNSKGKPERDILFPALVLLVSGAHTELVYMKKHNSYEVIGKTRDDAAGEALDKAARIILNEHIYPGGSVIERLALKGDENFLALPIPMKQSRDLDFSYSGIKTALLYAVQKMGDEQRSIHMADLAASFQKSVFTSIAIKLQTALIQYKVSSILVGGGVGANEYMRNIIKKEAKKHAIPVYFPYTKKLYGDNAAMIGVAAFYKGLDAQAKDIETVQRSARAELH